ncbi:hypothetical protein DPMN_058091 [Dreissena polymorpha]|uniref:Uncharacterized protein n=1 Tax=Dreissena polymorpha TaxID=45954 RepID=A0A9D4HF20_DREPO|nr:hypothetical protein DPMN_058091 [Dreissena polymorpha]
MGPNQSISSSPRILNSVRECYTKFEYAYSPSMHQVRVCTKSEYAPSMSLHPVRVLHPVGVCGTQS